MKNLEIKASCDSIEKAREACARLGAEFQWRRRQRDIYFAAASGRRLKLRVEDNAPPLLVSYARPDERDARTCDYRLLDLYGKCHSECMAFFRSALPVVCEVSKMRELHTLEGTRIHIDEVDGLGVFVEFELPLDGRDEGEARAKAAELTEAFGIREEDLHGGSYCDMLSAP